MAAVRAKQKAGQSLWGQLSCPSGDSHRKHLDDENGEQVALKEGAPVKVTIEAGKDDTTKKASGCRTAK